MTIISSDEAEEMYRRHADELMRFATSLVGPSDAADTVSIAFLGALGAGALARSENPRAYLYRCVLNAARSTARSSDRRHRREHAVASNHPTTSPAPEADPEVWSALGRLSERQRAVLYLTYWLDMDPAGIADLLDITPGAVKKHLDRGRRALRPMLGGHQ